MKKLAITLLVSLIVLTGCGGSYPSFEGMTVKKKEQIDGNVIASTKYIVTLEKNGQEIDLRPMSIADYNVLKVGQIINVKYDSEYFIRDIEFPELEGDDYIGDN